MQSAWSLGDGDGYSAFSKYDENLSKGAERPDLRCTLFKIE